MIWWIFSHPLPNILAMALYFKHLHHPTIRDAKCFGVPKLQGADDALEIYQPDSLILLAITERALVKNLLHFSTEIRGKVYACCTLHGNKFSAEEFLPKAYQNKYPDMVDRWPEVLPIKDYWEFEKEDFFTYADHGIAQAVRGWRGRLSALSRKVEESMQEPLSRAKKNAKHTKL